MAFHRNSDRARSWSKWVELHRDELNRCGIPPFLTDDEFRWLRFVEHGYDGETGWSPKLLTAAASAKLAEFIRREHPDNLLHFPG